jgi:hypothetical protein
MTPSALSLLLLLLLLLLPPLLPKPPLPPLLPKPPLPLPPLLVLAGCDDERAGRIARG